jgi:putative phosphonate transport system ATP-binding protein
MQQRLQIARNLVTGPRLVFMDEPTGGLDVSVQARLLDLLRGLVREMGLSAIVVTHDLAVVRLLAHRLMVMKDGPGGRDGADRPGAGRPAARLYPASGRASCR